MQPLPDPRFLPHFQVFGLASAGRDVGNYTFEFNTLSLHLNFFHRFLHSTDHPFYFEKIKVFVTQLKGFDNAQKIENEVFSELTQDFPAMNFKFFPERKGGRNYYRHICFQVNAENKEGIELNLIDGGFVDWTQKFMSNKKERILTSSIGSELVCLHFLK